MKRILFTILIFSLISCSENEDYAKPLYLKKIYIKNGQIDWYYKSLISNETPFLVTLQIQDKIDTIINADNICDVVLFKMDSLVIYCDGNPTLFGEIIGYKKSINSIKIFCDTKYCESMRDKIKSTF